MAYQLYCARLHSSYTTHELEDLLRRSPLRDARAFLHHRTHLGIERPLR